MIDSETLDTAVAQNVAAALAEDVGSGDITAALIPKRNRSRAVVVARQPATICGRPWVDRVFASLDPNLKLEWLAEEGEQVESEQALLRIAGNARAVLTGERTALNFLQTLSGTATICHYFAAIVAETGVKLLDTRKTIPGLRIAQKYAVEMGGCHNHRLGLYDAFLIKENHIAACGSIQTAIQAAREHFPEKAVEVEVENLDEVDEALQAQADIIMLDNFSLGDMVTAVERNAGQAKLEASGGILEPTLRPIAETGVDYISIGTLTKDCRSIDLSLRFK